MAKAIPKEIGRQYIESDSLPEEGTEELAEAYRKISLINDVKFNAIPLDVVFQEEDPYSSFGDMKESVEEEGIFRVFSGGTHPSIISKEENIKGRAVHDWYGHLDANCDFSFEGEYTKWQHVKGDYPEECHSVLFAEVVGQVAATHYLDGGFANERFTQRPCKAPSEWLDMAREFVNQ